MSIQCIQCGYSITEPVCASCVVHEIKTWLYGQRTNRNILKKIDKQFRSLSNHVESLDYAIFFSKKLWKSSGIRCIRCGKDMHLMCFYCVTNQASQIVKNNLKNKFEIANFSESFNMALYDYELDKPKSFLIAKEKESFY